MKDQIREEVQNWRFVPASDIAADILLLKDSNYLKEFFEKELNSKINWQNVKLPIHYDMCTSKDEHEEFFFDSDLSLEEQVIDPGFDDEFFSNNEIQIISALDFLTKMCAADPDEVIEFAKDFQER